MSPHSIRLPSWRGSAELALNVLLLSGLTAYYVFQCSAGTYATLRWNSEYYDLAAEGFRRGQLHLPVAPNPLLLAQPNPYDPALRAWWLWDAILWQGRYYIYWGPAPALGLAAYKVLTGQPAKVFDQSLVLVFMLGRLYAGATLIWSMASRASWRVPAWASGLAICMFGLASPTPYMMVRPLVYEASVAAGQCFVFMGLCLAFWAVYRCRLLTAVLAGTCFGLALHSRVTWLLVAPLLAAVCAYAFARRSSGPRFPAFVRALCAFGVPVAIAIGLAGAYNYARFGSVTDFGIAHQLTGRPFTSDVRFALPNLYSYLFAELDWSCRFPFAQVSVHRVLPQYIIWPPDYDLGEWAFGERVSGVYVTSPICWLALFLLVRPLERMWRQFHEIGPARWPALSSMDLWMLACAACCLLSLLPALGGYAASMRYLEDASGPALVIGLIGAFQLLRSRLIAVRRLGSTAFVLLALYTIGVGVFLGFSGITDNFARQNPVLYMTLVNAWSVCPKPL